MEDAMINLKRAKAAFEVHSTREREAILVARKAINDMDSGREAVRAAEIYAAESFLGFPRRRPDGSDYQPSQQKDEGRRMQLRRDVRTAVLADMYEEAADAGLIATEGHVVGRPPRETRLAKALALGAEGDVQMVAYTGLGDVGRISPGMRWTRTDPVFGSECCLWVVVREVSHEG